MALKNPLLLRMLAAFQRIVDDDGGTVFVVPPKNSDTLADTIIKLLKDEKLRKQMGENVIRN